MTQLCKARIDLNDNSYFCGRTKSHLGNHMVVVVFGDEDVTK